MSKDTVTKYGNYLREVISLDLIMGDEYQIGGPGIMVKIDDLKFGKQKYLVSIFVQSTFLLLEISYQLIFL